MSKNDLAKSNVSKSQDLFSLDIAYKNLLEEIKSKLRVAQLRATIAVNVELIHFYWEIGTLILSKEQHSKWGDKLYDVLAHDLSASFPGTKGFSKTNLKYMRLFAFHYPQAEFSQALPDQLTWTHHVVLAQMLSPQELVLKQWYAQQTIDNGWPYRELQKQIKSNLYSRQAHNEIKITNFKDKLPSSQSQLANELLKDPYKFHFLTLGDDAHEKEVHQGLLAHVKQFLMELGHGFALYGTHHPIYVSGKRFEIDLLMYNTKLHAYVVIEIKRGEFDPRDTGQLNFYLSAVDDQLKMPEDGQTIGLLLCEKKDCVIAEYALRRVDSPMGISEYELSKALPPKMHNILPTTDQIEAELNNFSKENQREETE